MQGGGVLILVHNVQASELVDLVRGHASDDSFSRIEAMVCKVTLADG